MGIYIFSWPVLKEALIKLKDQPNCDFGKHIIPYCHEKGYRLFAYEYTGYWKDVGTLSSYWEANMKSSGRSTQTVRIFHLSISRNRVW